MTAELTVIVPTFNEIANIQPLINKLEESLKGISWEAIFVDDDSPDGTSTKVREISLVDSRIRCIQRIDRRGLSSACIEGMLACASPFIAVIDADLQHDESLLPKMLDLLRTCDAELVIGSRYSSGGGIGEWSKGRYLISKLSTIIAQRTTGTNLTDPMSGFFMLSRTLLDRVIHRLSGKGFKILLDIFLSSKKPISFVELPYTFRTRQHGVSKLDLKVVYDFLFLISDKTLGKFIPIKFVVFVMMGLAGAIVHLSVLWSQMVILHKSFYYSQAIATFFAIFINYTLNNFLTHRDKQLRGAAFFRGLVSFYLICGIGAIANLQFALFLYNLHVPWWIAGLNGAIIGGVWNYAVSSSLTWGGRSNR